MLMTHIVRLQREGFGWKDSLGCVGFQAQFACFLILQNIKKPVATQITVMVMLDRYKHFSTSNRFV